MHLLKLRALPNIFTVTPSITPGEMNINSMIYNIQPKNQTSPVIPKLCLITALPPTRFNQVHALHLGFIYIYIHPFSPLLLFFITLSFVWLFFFLDFIYLVLEREEGRENEREGNINVWLHLMSPTQGTWPATQACALTGDRTCDPLVHRPALNPQSHTSQGCLGVVFLFKNLSYLRHYLTFWIG